MALRVTHGRKPHRRGPQGPALPGEAGLVMASDTENAADRFVDALANVLQACRESGSASITLRGELAKARADAEKLLSTKEYSDAVFKAALIANSGWE
jgi:hypothetical protein